MTRSTQDALVETQRKLDEANRRLDQWNKVGDAIFAKTKTIHQLAVMVQGIRSSANIKFGRVSHQHPNLQTIRKETKNA